MVLGAVMQPLGWQYWLDHMFQYLCAQLFEADNGIVLSGQDHRVDGYRLAVFTVTHGDLALGIRAQPGQRFVLAQLGLTLNQQMGIENRCRHQGVGFVGGITKHKALVASPQLFVVGFVHAHGNIGRLFTDSVENRHALAVKTQVAVIVTNASDHVADDIFNIDISHSTHFTGNNDHAGFYHRLNGDSCFRVIFQDGVKNGIGNLISDFIRMPFGY